MRIGSLFDGSGTAPLAATMCGIDPVWASEIEPYPIKVTKARFPGMLHLGDIMKIDGAEVVPVDIICGGSPCQDLSVAGKQAGLHNGERSHLFFEMTRIIKQMREATNGKYPRYCIFENVPGAFSSNKGHDFLAVLKAFAEIADPEIYVPEPKQKAHGAGLAWKPAGFMGGDGWSIAWRTVDAQYWGVPQRRRRIYLVADFAGECADEILFERTGMSGNPEPRGTEREETAADAGGSIAGSGGVICLNDQGGNVMSVSQDITATLRAQEHGHQPIVAAAFMGGQGAKARSIAYCDDGTTPTIKSVMSGGNTVPDVVYGIEGNTIDRNSSKNGSGVCVDVSPYTALAIGNGQLRNISMAEQSNTLDCMHDKQAVLTNGKPPRKYIVRRLTPLECCRLQGFPDWWEEGVEGSDSARYKMWGNGMALPNMIHVMRGIVEMDKRKDTEK